MSPRRVGARDLMARTPPGSAPECAGYPDSHPGPTRWWYIGRTLTPRPPKPLPHPPVLPDTPNPARHQPRCIPRSGSPHIPPCNSPCKYQVEGGFWVREQSMGQPWSRSLRPRAKVDEEYPSVRVRQAGWCDRAGGLRVARRVRRRRHRRDQVVAHDPGRERPGPVRSGPAIRRGDATGPRVGTHSTLLPHVRCALPPPGPLTHTVRTLTQVRTDVRELGVAGGSMAAPIDAGLDIGAASEGAGSGR